MHYYCLAFPCVIVLYLLFDVHYFIRFFFATGWGRLFQKRSKILEKHYNYGICLSTDVDIFLSHMNNARYLRELDFARSYFYDRSGIFGEIRRRKASVVQAATSIRYRRPINVFTIYKVTTQLIHWDERSLFIEHEFVSVRDNFVRAVALSKQTISCRNKDVMAHHVLEKLEPDVLKPAVSEELQLWNECLDASSRRFRKIRGELAARPAAPSPGPSTSLLEAGVLS